MKYDVDKRKGYCRVKLSKPIFGRFLVHRIVAETFIPNPNNLSIINHIDNNPSNNNINNLEWCTQSTNLLHAQKQGRLYKAQSKGGITTTIRNQTIAKEKAIALIGKQVNSWTVLKYVGKLPIGSKGIHRETLLCRCKCGYTQNITSIRLLNKQVTCCRKCSKNKNKDIV